jgi:hypothetical protein
MQRASSSTDNTMYVVYLTRKGLEHHQKESDATSTLALEPALMQQISRQKPDKVAAVLIADKKLNGLNNGKDDKQNEKVWPNHFIIANRRIMDALALRYQETKVDSIPCVLVHANGNRPGGQRLGSGQEESIVQNSNISYGMRNAYPKADIWESLGGIYAILCRTVEGNPFWAIVNPAPNLNDEPIIFTAEDGKEVMTPSDAKLFDRHANCPEIMNNPELFMRHILGEVLMQFYMVKSLGGREFTTGLFGCGMFNGNPEYYAAAVKFVSALTTFSEIKVSYALGNNNESISGRNVYDIFTNPRADMLEMAAKLHERFYSDLCVDENPNIVLHEVSSAVKKFYREELPKITMQAKSRPGLFSGFLSALWSGGSKNDSAATPVTRKSSP